jgi:thiamine kinase-like enzyme
VAQESGGVMLEYTKISSNYTRKKQKVMTIEDVAKNKSKRNHKKRHSVEREKAQFEERKKNKIEVYNNEKKRIMKDFKKLVKAYWNNEIINHPNKPKLPPKPRYDLPAKTRTKYK